MSRKILVFLLLVILAAPAAWSKAATGPTFYYTYKSSSTSDYIPEFDITLDSNTYNLLQDFPAANTLSQIDWTSSHSYAKSYIVAKTSGGRLFRMRGSGTGAIDVQEYDPITLQPTGASAYLGYANLFTYVNVIDIVVSGDYVYWFHHGVGREFYNLSTGASDYLSVSCQAIAGSATHVFCMQITDDTGATSYGGDNIEFFQINRATGDVQYDHGRWNFGSNSSTTQSWGFAADGAIVYATRPNGTYTELWRFDTAAFLQSAEKPTLQFSIDLGGHPNRIDADAGFVMLPALGSEIIIYDTSADTFETFTTALSAGYPEFMIQEVPEPSPADSVPDPDTAPDSGDTSGESMGNESSSGGGGGCFIISLLK